MKEQEWDYRVEISGKRVLVVGAGRSGIGSVHLLNKVGAHPVLLEENASKEEDTIREALFAEDRDNTKIIIGKLTKNDCEDLCAAVISPGVPIDSGVVLMLKENGIPVLSEVELAYRFMKGKLVAITGTNGKTTTTSLVGEILKQTWRYGAEEVFVVGNIGESFAMHALETTNNSVTVAEISSFQLEAVERFHADVACILNITPDHLDRHHNMETYVGLKERVTINQRPKEGKTGLTDTCVLNRDDPYAADFYENRYNGCAIWFSSTGPVPVGFWLDNDMIRLRCGSNDEAVIRPSESRLKGLCNTENIMAALGIVLGLGIRPHLALDAIRGFQPVAHRIEYIATKNGVEYYNDSKATNPDSAIQGIKAMDRPTILIGGGYDKQSDYDAWTALFEGRVKELVLIGETADAIEKSARKNGFTNIHHAGSFEEALAYSTTQAGRGDAVLLSPACASWDMFQSYEERGDRFRDYCLSLAD